MSKSLKHWPYACSLIATRLCMFLPRGRSHNVRPDCDTLIVGGTMQSNNAYLAGKNVCVPVQEDITLSKIPNLESNLVTSFFSQPDQ